MNEQEKEFSRFLEAFSEHQAAIEGLRPLKRPMLLWSTASLVYVFGGLQLKVNAASLWGFQIVGLTDTKLTIFLILTTLYYTARWLWTRRLRLRTYRDEGFMRLLRQYGMPRSGKKSGASVIFDGLKGLNKEVNSDFLRICREPFIATRKERPNLGSINELFDLKFLPSVVSFVEHTVIPYLAPLTIAMTALIALGLRLYWCV